MDKKTIVDVTADTIEGILFDFMKMENVSKEDQRFAAKKLVYAWKSYELDCLREECVISTDLYKEAKETLNNEWNRVLASRS